MNKILGCFKVQVGWKNAFYGETGSRKGLGETLTIKKHFLTFTLSVNKIIIYQFSMFKSLDSIASVVGIFMYLTISKFKQVLRSRGKVSTTTLVIGLVLLENMDTYQCPCWHYFSTLLNGNSWVFVLAFWVYMIIQMFIFMSKSWFFLISGFLFLQISLCLNIFLKEEEVATKERKK